MQGGTERPEDHSFSRSPVVQPRNPGTRHSRLKGIACNYCRGKKLKCDGKKPACQNCQKRGLDCVAQVPLQRMRPTNGRIRELEYETNRLRAELHRSQKTHGNQTDQEVQNGGARLISPVVSVHVDQESPGVSEAQSPVRDTAVREESSTSTTPHHTNVQAVSSAKSLVGEVLSYHGPTSALYDEQFLSHETQSNLNPPDLTDDALARCTLVVETSKQRQLEPINLSLNLLDFDGVDPDLGMQLLSLYWSRQLHAGLLVYRSVFMRDMACGGPYFSKLLLNAMYYSVSKHCPDLSIRHDASSRDSAGWSFRERFRVLLRDEFDKSSITTIQGLLIMASSLFTRCDERSTSWLYAGNAFNMLTDMGLNVWPVSTRKTTPEESEIHARVFWAAYMIDKVQCLYQGRHPSLRIADKNVPLIFHDDYEELEKFDGTSFITAQSSHSVPSFTVSKFRALCELSLIMEKIHRNIYAVSYLTTSSSSYIAESNSLYSDLKAWRRSLPVHLDFLSSGFRGTPLPYALSMLALYNVLVILTHRMLVSEGDDAGGSCRSPEAFSNCMIAANEIVQILKVYGELYDPSSATFVLSYATYISAKVYLHNISMLNTSTRESSLESLHFCLDALDQHQKLYTAAVRAKETISKLMARLKIRIKGDSNCATTTDQHLEKHLNLASSKGGQEICQGNGSVSLARAVHPVQLGVDNLGLLNTNIGLES
ncbi:hypothetical protein QWA68_015082 [Fusarium oxysporum]|nr:hypothetical protein QWA68_015082 [Fusarium oxysporum]